MTTKQTCSRCGGSGQYSFNLKDGTVCYGCSGSGFQMVDLQAKAHRQSVMEAKRQVNESNRQQYILRMSEVKSHFNQIYGPFDLETLLGIDQLNCAVSRATGKTLVQHTKEKLQCK